MILILDVRVGSPQNYHLGKNHRTTVVLLPVFNKFLLVSVGFSFSFYVWFWYLKGGKVSVIRFLK